MNLLIATSVAEEGLDIQSCKLVVRFDAFASITEYIQSRGRARDPNSTYVVMVPKGMKQSFSRLRKITAYLLYFR